MRTKKEISLWNEIDPDQQTNFNIFLCLKLQPSLDRHRKEYTDAEWEDVLALFQESNAQAKDIDSCFAATDLSNWDTYYLKDDHFALVIRGYFGLPHATMAMDLFCEIVVPFTELKKYLKRDSIFQRLSTDD